MIRVENNRIDKVFCKKYFEEIEKVIKSSQGIDDLSEHTRLFEKKFANYIGVKHSYCVNSGTDALQIALLCLGAGNGDEVIVPDLTYISTALVVKYVGAKPVFVDVKKDDLTIDEGKIEEAITDKTKAIMPVHMFGHPCNVPAIRDIAEEHGLKIIEDCCQAFSSSLNNKRVGSFGDMAAFSFSYYKPLSSLSGNGGMITFNESGLLELIDKRIKLWRCDDLLEGTSRKFHKISLTDAATAMVKFRYFRIISESRIKAMKAYREGLEDIKDVEMPVERGGSTALMENFVILAENRDGLMKHLERNGIKTGHPYRPMHSIKLFGCMGRNFPATNRYYEKGIHLPLYSLMKGSEVEAVVKIIREFYS